jgi:hypothetical protein
MAPRDPGEITPAEGPSSRHFEAASVSKGGYPIGGVSVFPGLGGKNGRPTLM